MHNNTKSNNTKKFKEGKFSYGQEITVRISDLTNLGIGLGRYDDFVVMIPYALPEELVRARIWRNHKNYAEADMIEIIEASQDRQEPKCTLFGKCGGCQYQHLKYESQLKWKQKQISDLMKRIGGIEFAVNSTHPSPKIFGYRSKLTPHYETRRHDGSMPIGFIMQGRRNKIVDVEECPIASSSINEALPDEREKILQKADSLKRGGTILLRDSLEGVITDNTVAACEKVGDLTLEFIAGEFFQNNPSILPELITYAIEKAFGNEYLVDSYCGVGVFALSASKKFKRVIGVEISEQSILCAKRNAKMNGIQNCEFLAASSEKIFSSIDFSGRECSMIIDPPRSGCSQEFLDQLIKFSPNRLVYVSCAPDTQARDLKFLIENGYKLLELQPFDMFPNTRHIESVAVLELQ